MSEKPQPDRYRLAAQNRKAFHDYHIEEQLEAGIMLTGGEVKALRAGKANITDAYGGPMQGEIWLFNASIEEAGNVPSFARSETRRPRKLLLGKREIAKLLGRLKVKGVTLIPLDIHFNKRGFAKVTVGVATGKKQHDKRASIKEKDWQREKQRALKQRH
ncbi:MAG: SsrA-binding protein SmpB [Alphaproteobacteria bacterium]|nr:SsrA-binding protein SmpB [Alphaproteobacteria bacterium]